MKLNEPRIQLVKIVELKAGDVVFVPISQLYAGNVMKEEKKKSSKEPKLGRFAKKKLKRRRKPKTEDQTSILQKYLSQSHGKYALASSLVAPLRRARDYASFGRKLFPVANLPMGAMKEHWLKQVLAHNKAKLPVIIVFKKGALPL